MSTTPPDRRTLLVADIGGTHARAGLVTRPGEAPARVVRHPTAAFEGLAAFLTAALEELSDHPRPTHAVCAVASPIDHDPIELTNAGWRFSPAAVAHAVGLERVSFVNDWVAQGWAVTRLDAADCQTIQTGSPDGSAPRLALGPGTGLGSALVVPCASGWQVFATEGGHITHAPQGRRERLVVDHIAQRFGHCSAERLASGIGLAAIHDALLAIEGEPPRHTSAQAIARAGLAGDPLCRETIERMTDALGSAAGNLALATGARGGLYVGGGVIPALGDAFDWSRFQTRFRAKGRFHDYLAGIPIRAINHPAAALLGLSAREAARRDTA
jgi:glucokinase